MTNEVRQLFADLFKPNPLQDLEGVFLFQTKKKHTPHRVAILYRTPPFWNKIGFFGLVCLFLVYHFYIWFKFGKIWIGSVYRDLGQFFFVFAGVGLVRLVPGSQL